MVGVLIIIDGCNEDYISAGTTPFLYSLKNRSPYSSMKVSAGFATRFELFTGRTARATDTFVDFIRGDSIMPFRALKVFKPSFDIKIRQSPYRKIFNSSTPFLTLTNLALTGIWTDFVNIPKFLIPYFRLNNSLVKLKRDEKNREPNNLLGILAADGFEVDFIYGNADKIDKSVSKIVNLDKRVIIIHYGETDRTGHTYGPGSAEVNGVLSRVDDSIRRIFESFEGELDFMAVFSDHDMTDILDNLDLWSLLKKLDCSLIKDYFVFLNSPLARFWFKNRVAEVEVIRLLKSLEDYGRIVERDELRDHMLPDDDKYGETIFWANKGVNISPDFYSISKRKGMHGYLDQKSAAPFIFYNSRKVKFSDQRCNMRDLTPTILDYLKIDYEDVEGKSILAG